MRRLAAPLRLTWDWDWPPIVHPGAPRRRPTPEEVRTIGAEIVRAGVLLLEVGYPDAQAVRSGELAGALAGFAGSLSVVLDPRGAEALAGVDLCADLGAEEVWVDATPVGDCGLPAVPAAWPAVRFHLTAANAAAVAAGIERAAGAGATAVSLPNLPLFGELLRAQGAAPTARELGVVADAIVAALRRRPDLDLRIHHYGLWERLRAAGVQPRGEAGEGGCQAGAALAYIDPAGVLHPCASLPVPLARVGSGAIRAAWAGAELAALRAEVERVPARCAACPAEASCRGGCRGWAHYLTGTWDATGPDCTRP
ncbi:MAG TPA: SPASM domain-containing protein [bacterium]